MAEKKLVRVTAKETLMSCLGRLEKGRTYEIPEDRFSAWEKAGLVEKAKEPDRKAAGDGGKE